MISPLYSNPPTVFSLANAASVKSIVIPPVGILMLPLSVESLEHALKNTGVVILLLN